MPRHNQRGTPRWSQRRERGKKRSTRTPLTRRFSKAERMAWRWRLAQ